MAHTTRILTLGLLGLVVACGDEPAPKTAPQRADVAEMAEPTLQEAEEAAASNSWPRIERIRFEPEEPVVGDIVRAVVETSDDDGDNISLQYEWSLDGEPLEVDSKQLELSAGVFTRGATLELSVVASDGKDEVSDHYSEDLGNAVPTLLTVEILTKGELHSGAPITLRPDARDADGDDLTFRYEWQVNGRPVRTKGPVLETDRLRRGDEVRARIVVADEDDESEPFETPLFTIANSPPKVVSQPPDSSNDGTFRYQIEATDPDGDRNLQFHLENEPDGMTIDHVRGSIVWVPTPDQAGQHMASVIVDDLQGGKTRHTIEINVAPPGGAQPPAARDRDSQ